MFRWEKNRLNVFVILQKRYTNKKIKFNLFLIFQLFPVIFFRRRNGFGLSARARPGLARINKMRGSGKRLPMSASFSVSCLGSTGNANAAQSVCQESFACRGRSQPSCQLSTPSKGWKEEQLLPSIGAIIWHSLQWSSHRKAKRNPTPRINWRLSVENVVRMMTRQSPLWITDNSTRTYSVNSEANAGFSEPGMRSTSKKKLNLASCSRNENGNLTWHLEISHTNLGGHHQGPLMFSLKSIFISY